MKPYRCSAWIYDAERNRKKCTGRSWLPDGTANGVELCPRCGKATLALDKSRSKTTEVSFL